MQTYAFVAAFLAAVAASASAAPLSKSTAVASGASLSHHLHAAPRTTPVGGKTLFRRDDAPPAPAPAPAPAPSPAPAPAPEGDNDNQPAAPQNDANTPPPPPPQDDNDQKDPAPPKESEAPAPPSDGDAAPAPDADTIKKPNGKIVTKLQFKDFSAKGHAQIDGKTVSSKDAQLATDGGIDLPLVFLEAEANVIGASGEGKTHYGILTLEGQEKEKCVQPAALAKPDQPLAIVDCSLSDDSSQLAQIFEYNEDGKVIEFVGRVSPGEHYVVGEKDGFVTVSPDGDSKKLTLA